MKTAMGFLAAVAISGFAATGMTSAASADDYDSYYKKDNKAVFIDKPGYKYDACAFNKYPGKNVYFQTKAVELYGYKYTVLIGTCKIPLRSPANKNTTLRNFKCKYVDRNYDYVDVENEIAFFSKYRVKKYEPYAYLTCKWLIDQDDDYESGTPKDVPAPSAQ